jgi:hypothetical protein
MKKILILSTFLWIGIYGRGQAESNLHKCPELNPVDLQQLQGGRLLHKDPHKWYLHDMFEMTDKSGSPIPIELSVDDVMQAKSVNFLEQLDSRTCQYTIVIEKDTPA